MRRRDVTRLLLDDAFAREAAKKTHSVGETLEAHLRRTPQSLRRAWFVTSFSHFRTDLSCEEARIARLVPHRHRQRAEDQLQQPDDVIARNYNDVTR